MGEKKQRKIGNINEKYLSIVWGDGPGHCNENPPAAKIGSILCVVNFRH